MHKSQAYALLAAELEAWRALPIRDVLAQLNCQALVKSKVFDGEIIDMEISVHWLDEYKKQICVQAIALGASTWKMERLEEAIVLDVDNALLWNSE